MIVINNLNKLVLGFTHSSISEYHPELTIQKAGIWQGIDSYKDQNMLVVRDVNLYVDLFKPHENLVNYIKPDKEWCDIHFAERICGKPLNPGESYKVWPYANLKDGDGFIKDKQFDHTYMERFWPKQAGPNLEYENSYNKGIRFEYGDLDDVIKQLKYNPLTRQAYLPIFFPEDTGSKGNLRVPCTLGYLFEIIPDAEGNPKSLDITYYIRSCDVLRHLRNDIYLAYLLAAYVMDQTGLEIELGTLKMKIANLHLFENDTYALVKKENNLKTYQWKEKE